MLNTARTPLRGILNGRCAAILLACAVFGLGAPALADGSDWRVSDLQGAARVRTGNGGSWNALKRGDEIAPGSEVITDKSGRLLLVRPGDSINVAPNSRFAIPQDARRVSTPANPTTHIVQKLGTLLFKITTRPDKPFSVKTPYLAAVIKGTTFTVAVDRQNSALHVSKGAVLVNSILGGDSVLVRPGQTAAAGPANGGKLHLMGFKRLNSPRKKVGKASQAAAKTPNATKSPAAARTANPGITAADLTAGKRAARTFKIGRAVGAGRINIAKVSKGLLADGETPRRRGKGRKATRSVAQKTGNASDQTDIPVERPNANESLDSTGSGAADRKAIGSSGDVVIANALGSSGSKSGGSAGGNGLGNAAGDSGGNGRGNALGKSESNASGNAGGNGLGNAAGNTGGNAASNAGGNGLGNAGGNAGGSSLGNAVSNSGGSSLGSAGGNGLGNAGSNGLGNASSNGLGNAASDSGGSNLGSAGGNGLGNAFGKSDDKAADKAASKAGKAKKS